MGTDIGFNNQLSEEEDDIEVYYDRLYVRWERLNQLLKLEKRFNHQKRLYGWCRKDKNLTKTPKNVSEENHFSGFMSCIFFLKFIRECEETHYEYLLKNKVFYNRGAFFIDFDFSKFFNPIDFFYWFHRYEEQKVLQKIMEGLFIELIEKLEESIYENDEDIDVFKKFLKKNVHKLPLNFIQVIKESGFTPPVRL